MSIRSLSVRALVPLACLCAGLFTVSPAFAQQAAPATPQASQTAPPATSAPAPASKEPDYPDQRTLWFGVDALAPTAISGPDLKGGAQSAAANNYATLYNLGKPYKITGMLEGGVPVTRTGMVYFDFERYHGYNDQTLPSTLNGKPMTGVTVLDTYSFNPGDALHSIYHVYSGRIYLDDLLYPHKFPVSRLRFRSIWGLRYTSVYQSVISATEDAKAGLGGASYNVATSFILYPEFGLAMEYAVAPHVLFRVDGAGFGIPHHSTMNEGSATISVRQKNLEIVGGIKTLYFKTTPQKQEYTQANFMAPFIGVRWHF